jgi:hypothetical protein
VESSSQASNLLTRDSLLTPARPMPDLESLPTQITGSDSGAQLTKAWAILSNCDSWLNKDEFNKCMTQGLTIELLTVMDENDINEEIVSKLKLYPAKLFAKYLVSKF